MSPKDTILARRARFVAAAVATFAGCADGPQDPGPSVCLTPISDTGVSDTTVVDGGADTTDTGPTVCLSPPLDSGVDTGTPDTFSTDTGPTVCLSAPLDTGLLDTGSTDAATDAADTGPVPCLVPPPG
ncbi:MAG: hypothetical protein IPJ34_00190 [Myxococcales bacterium]|nr:hypothetical protein [Myxococcales bacterium]